MSQNKIKLLDRIVMLLSGAFSSCALFIKYGDDIFHFSSPNSIGKDWKSVSEDMGVAMYKLREQYENEQPEQEIQ